VPAVRTAALRLLRDLVAALPEPVAHGLGDVVAEAVLLRRAPAVRRLERNLLRVAPHRRPDRRTLLRTALRATVRSAVDTLRLHRWTAADLDARTEVHGAERVRTLLAAGRPVVVALPHAGSWDQAGAWAARHLAPVLTVAERLRPEARFRAFTELRARLGVTVLPLDARTYPALRARQRPGSLTGLVTDRSVGSPGLPVRLAGHEARFGAAAARLAVDTGAALVAATLHVEPRGSRGGAPRRVLVVRFSGELRSDPDASRRDGTADLMQQVADVFAASFRDHPEDWHMLQPVFADDLPGRAA
jgi:phosphatidylinositol dimannoside acyltransferase